MVRLFLLLSLAAPFSLGALPNGGAAAAVTLEDASRHLLIAEAAAGDPAVASFYLEENYEAVWTDDAPDDRARRLALLAALESAGDHGLPLARYPAAEVSALLAGAGDAQGRAAAEVGLSRLFLRYARELAHGVLVPSQIDPGIVREVPYADPESLLRGFARAETPGEFLRGLAPSSPEYLRLMKERLRLAEIVAGSDWGPEVDASILKPGETGPAVLALRDRLVRMGYLPFTSAPEYDDALRAAVEAFQTDHGLVADGVAGPETMGELNTGPERRLRQVLVAMERERWTNMERGDRHIWVNLADFSTRIIDDGKVTFETRAVIGATPPDRRSPEFSDMMEHMVVNPTWHVPRSIAVGEYLPQFKRNPYSNRNLEIYYKGEAISRDRINWAAVTAQNWPFALKEPPSRSNALGLVKFMFPNKWNIYLHDTPAKDLFERDVRAFSHGCIRLNDPFEFAYTLLAPQTDDPVGFFQAKLQTGAETTVPLAEPVPVHLVYRTAIAPAKGRMNYRRDIYGRDARIWEALEAAGVVSVALEG